MNNATEDRAYSQIIEKISIGSLYLSLGTIFFTLLCCCLYVMLTRRRAFRVNSSRQYHAILQQIIFADIIQVFFSGIVTGLFVLSPDLSSVWWLNTACGALASGAWFLYSFSANLLAFNRFVHIVYNDKVDQIFSPKLTARYLVVLYIYSFLWILVLISPPIGIKFSPNHNTYVCNKLDKYCFWMSRAALVFDWINVTCICVFYTILCVKVRFKIKNCSKTLNQMRQIKSEIKVVYQSLLICLSSVTYIVVFFLPIEKNKLSMVIDHSIWICLSGTNSLILLTMNSTMKDQFRMVINKRRKPAVTVISTRIKD